MNRLLTLASTGLFATGLAILPISAFAQQNATTGKTDAKVVTPTTQTSSTDAKPVAPGVKTEPTAKKTVVAKDTKAHHVKHVVSPTASTSANTAKVAAHPAAPTAQPKTADQSKS